MERLPLIFQVCWCSSKCPSKRKVTGENRRKCDVGRKNQSCVCQLEEGTSQRMKAAAKGWKMQENCCPLEAAEGMLACMPAPSSSTGETHVGLLSSRANR